MAIEEKKGKKLPECTRFDAAYETMKASPNEANYIAMLEALEADLKADAAGYMPIESKEAVETLQKEGKMRWPALKTPRGQMLTLFTTVAQASKKSPAASISINLAAFFKVMTDNKDIAGFVVNPYDTQHGFLLDRKNLEIVLLRAKGQKMEIPRLDPALVGKAVERLFGCAVGVPKAVPEGTAELKSLGGPDALVLPLQGKWQRALQDGSFKPASPVEYVKTIAKDAMTQAFVSGALVTRGPDMVKNADADECVERVPYLRDDLVQNTDEYLVALCETLRTDLKLKDENVLWVTLANNIGHVAYGAAIFGFRWGLAKCRESERGEAGA